MGLRLDGLRCSAPWGVMLEDLEPDAKPKSAKPHKAPTLPPDVLKLLGVDYMPDSVSPATEYARLIILEDNDAVTKVCVKGRSRNMSHIWRTHRVDIDWIFERILLDSCIITQYVNTKVQIADIFTKAASPQLLGRIY